MEWVFDGIGTAIMSLIFGAIIGGTAGYKIGIKKNISQKQKGGDDSTMIQAGRDVKYK